MRMVEVSCPGCGRELEAEPSLAGTFVECPLCSQRFRIPKTPTFFRGRSGRNGREAETEKKAFRSERPQNGRKAESVRFGAGNRDEDSARTSGNEIRTEDHPRKRPARPLRNLQRQRTRLPVQNRGLRLGRHRRGRVRNRRGRQKTRRRRRHGRSRHLRIGFEEKEVISRNAAAARPA